MHFPIIILEEPSTNVEDWSIDVPYDDACIREHTDYTGDMYTPAERYDVINSTWLKELLDGFATLDTEQQTITFLDKETCFKHFQSYLRETIENLHEKADAGELRGYQMYLASQEYKGFSTLFVTDGYAQTSFDFADDAPYRAEKTYKIGNIIDAHI